MVTADTALDRLLEPLGDCLTPDVARRILGLKADQKLESRVHRLAERHRQGIITPAEYAEYTSYVKFGTFVAILKSKARRLLSSAQNDK